MYSVIYICLFQLFVEKCAVQAEFSYLVSLVFLLILVFDSEVLIVVPVLDEWSLAASLVCIILAD